MDAWGLHTQAHELRAALKKQRETETQENLLKFVHQLEGIKNGNP